MDIYTVIGLAGVAGYVASYALLQLGFLDGNGMRYSIANVIAAAFVLVSLAKDFNLASAVIQVTWIAIGVVGLSLRLLHGNPAVAQHDAAAAPDSMVPDTDLSRVDARPSSMMNDALHSQLCALVRSDSAATKEPVIKPSPFRVASHALGRTTFDLRPDTAPSDAGDTTVGLGADTAITSTAS